MYSTVGIRNPDTSEFRMVDMFGFQMVAASLDRFICKKNNLKIWKPDQKNVWFSNVSSFWIVGFRIPTVFKWSAKSCDFTIWIQDTHTLWYLDESGIQMVKVSDLMDQIYLLPQVAWTVLRVIKKYVLNQTRSRPALDK